MKKNGWLALLLVGILVVGGAVFLVARGAVDGVITAEGDLTAERYPYAYSINPTNYHFRLSVPEESAEFELTTEYGYFNRSNSVLAQQKVVTMTNGESIVWYEREKHSNTEYITYHKNFVRVLILQDEHIIGCAVLFTGSTNVEPYDGQFVVLVDSVAFPKVNGQYQDISREYAEKKMQHMIEAAPGYTTLDDYTIFPQWQ